MKKVLALTLAGMMAVSMFAVPVMAEAEAEAGTTADNPIVINYEEDVDPELYDGAWFDTDLGFDLWLPEDWEVQEISDEDAENGILYMAADMEKGTNVIIQATEVDDKYTTEQMVDDLDDGATDIVYAELSGLPSVIFEMPEDKQAGFSMLLPNNYVVIGLLTSPAETDEEYDEDTTMFANIIKSVSVTETEAETE